MVLTIQVQQRGALTLPVELRQRYNIQPGDTFRAVDLGGIFVLTPMAPMVPKLAREIERARIEAGLSVENMLQELREQRERYVAENDGDQLGQISAGIESTEK
jgi:bifunctional DNA-binding transcriptional regulator/antitoxin component of YhaV-PrlF toxin-antitoxin module